MRKFLLIFSIIVVMTLSACSQNIVNDNITDDISLEGLDKTTSISENTLTNETTSSPPIYQPTTQTFENIRIMKEEIDKKRNSDPQSSLNTLSNVNTSDLKELKWLNIDYVESWVELSDDGTYVIYYTTTDNVLAFIPFSSEKLLQKEMEIGYYLMEPMKIF